MNWNIIGLFSLIGVLISILYFSTAGLIRSEFATSEACSQLSDELDLSPVFDTNERSFTLDDGKISRSEVLFDNFVLKYDNYPEALINSLINRQNIKDKSTSNQQTRFIPNELRLYNSTTIRDLCKTNRTTIQPQAAKYGSRWIVVVNQNNFVQEVPVEQCIYPVDEDNELNLETSLLEEPELVKCRQAVSQINLHVLVNQKLVLYKFPYQSSCEPELI